MIYGYGRASTVGQVATEDVQRDTITKAAKHIGEFGGFYYDAATTGGTELFERPQGRKLYKEGKVYNNFIPTGWRRKGHDFHPDTEDRRQTELLATWREEGMTLRKMEIKARLQKIKRPRGTHWDRNTISVALKHRAQGYPKIPQAS